MGCLEGTIKEALANRVEDQVGTAARVAQGRPTVAAPGGQVKRLGGEPFTPNRELQYTGTAPVGAPIQYNQGLAAGKPLLPQSTQGATQLDNLEQIDVLIEQPEAKKYTIVFNSRYVAQVVDIFIPEGLSYIVSMEPGKRQILAKGGKLEVELVGNVTTDPLNMTIELRRI